MSLQVVVPYLAGMWCLEDLIETFGQSDVPVLMVDNSPGSDCTGREFPPNIQVQSFPENIGASAAWNLALAKGADQTLIVSQWVRFAPMEHNRRIGSWGLDHIARGIRKHANEWGCTFGDQGYHLISIGRRLVEAVGTFDENLFFYGNDDDYEHRMALAGVRGRQGTWGDYRDSGVYSISFGAHKRGASTGWEERSERVAPYYYDKWCSGRGKYPGDYLTPFNRPGWTVRDWPPVVR